MLDTVPFDMHCYSLDWHPKEVYKLRNPPPLSPKTTGRFNDVFWGRGCFVNHL